MREFIHDQTVYSSNKGTYGRWGSLARNGCGAIAVHNVCVRLNLAVSLADICSMLGRHALWGGMLGTNPLSLHRFLHGVGLKPHLYHRLGAVCPHDAYIVLYLYRRGFKVGGHYAALSPHGEGYMVYNDGQEQARYIPSLAALKKARRAFLLWVWGADRPD